MEKRQELIGEDLWRLARRACGGSVSYFSSPSSSRRRPEILEGAPVLRCSAATEGGKADAASARDRSSWDVSEKFTQVILSCRRGSPVTQTKTTKIPRHSTVFCGTKSLNRLRHTPEARVSLVRELGCSWLLRLAW
jgi:hypothetical protein